MRLHKIYTFLLLGMALLLSSCDKDKPKPPSKEDTRTVLAYVMADNSLSSFASKDIKEMMEGMETVDGSSCNLLVYIDENGSAPVLYHIYKNKKGEVVKEVVKEYEEQVSTDASVMQEAMNRAFSEYPADSYGLVIWSHGNGWIPNPLPAVKKPSSRWIGQDVTGGTHYMNITDMVSVFKNTPHLEFILFDACFGQTIEVAYELREYADYIIGSPTEIPGPGASYDGVVPAMFATKNVGVEIGKAYYEPYAAIYDESVRVTNDHWTGGVSVAVVKCDALDELAVATNQLLSSPSPSYSMLQSNVFDYNKTKGYTSDYDYTGYYDMRQLMQYLLVDMDAWNAAANNAIVYWRTTPKNFTGGAQQLFPIPEDKTCGVSHYIPSDDREAANAAYRSTAWYKAAGLSKLGW
jgi:hypothetical protein